MIAIAAVAGVLVLAAALCARKRKRGLALALTTSAMAIPFVAGGTPLTRFVAAIMAIWGLVRVWDLCRDPRPRSFPLRLWHLLAGFDTREATRCPPRLDRALVVSTAVHAAIATAGWFLAPTARWLGGAALVYGVAGSIDAGLRAAYLGLGLEIPRIQRHPIAARSIAEFWGRRWNRVVGSWLRANLYTPMARRGMKTGAPLMVFLASGLLHVYITWAALDIAAGALMGVFFLLQPMLIATERIFGVERWNAAWARVWTVTALFIASPIFVDPMLRILRR